MPFPIDLPYELGSEGERLRFESALLRILPPWLRRTVGAKLMASFGEVIDDLIDRNALAAKVRECATSYKFTAEMTKEFNGDDRFWPVDYKKDWAVVRQVAEATGTPFNRAAFDREAAKEAEAKKKK